MTDLAAALVNALDDEALDRLAELLAPRLAPPPADPWFTPSSAAQYLGLSGARRIHDLTSAGRLPVDGRDGRTPLYRRSTLDAYARQETTR